MADNEAVVVGAGRYLHKASDDVGDVFYDIMKLAFGALDAVTLVSSSNGLPVTVLSGGGGTEYTEAGTPPAHPVGGTIIWDSAGTWKAVSTATPLPIAGAVTYAALLTELQLKADFNETQPVSLASVPSHAVTNAGTFAVQAAATVADGADVAEGAIADAVVAAGATGSISAKLRAISRDLIANIVLAAGANLIGDVGIKPRTSGGLTTAMFSGSDGSSILVATAQVIKASAGQLFGYYCFNPEAAVTFVHFYNVAAASVTVGTTNPLFTLAIPAGSAANLMSEIGIPFSNAGWSCAATTTAGGNTAPATGASLVVWYA